jgi:site-specific recombinase XerD
MNKSFKTLFFLKKGNKFKGGALPIYLRITVEGKQVELSIQRSCERIKWNQSIGRAVGRTDDGVQLNNYLDTVQGKIFEIQREGEIKGYKVTAELAKQKLLGITTEREHNLVQIYEYHNQQFGQLAGTEYSVGTFKKFKSALTSLKKFIQWKFNLSDISILSLNYQFITEYEFYLKSIQGMQHNSAVGNIKKLRKIIRQCVNNDWLDKDPFAKYKLRIKETNRNYLLKDELEVLIHKKILGARLVQVKDIFLFSCFTGLSYSDIIKLTSQDIRIGIDGLQWIFITRTKTDAVSKIPILPIPKEIIEKYSLQLKVNSGGKILPQLSNQRLNSYLKEISDICGFKKELTFHCARHTFATTVTLSNGVPIETVGKMLGHRNLRTTQHYAKILDGKVSEDMQQLRERLKDFSNKEDESIKPSHLIAK